ncbi:MAG: hypothetical protein J5I94_03570 [Phaeodactylibacter sp.]|nr:hypothetical protein [Phaeodactylibacter sp.]
MRNISLIVLILGLSTQSLTAQENSQEPPDSALMTAAQTAVALEEMTLKIAQLEEKRAEQQELLHAQFEARNQKIILFSDFLNNANASVNAMLLSNTLTTYLNDVSALNNPTNNDLGFNLTEKVIQVVDETILQGEKKIGRLPKNRFFSFIGKYLGAPAASALSLALPVAQSIQSVSNLITGAALMDDDISVEKITEMNQKLKLYIEHYEGLSEALRKFNIANIGTKGKLEQLKNQLHNIALERSNVLYGDDLKIKKIIGKEGIEVFLEDHFNVNEIENRVRTVSEQYVIDGELALAAAWNDKHLAFPDFEIARSSVVADQIGAIADESINTLMDYQMDIEEVLKRSIEVGISDPAKVNARIEMMRQNLEEVKKSFENAVQVKEVKNKFQRLAGNSAGAHLP